MNYKKLHISTSKNIAMFILIPTIILTKAANEEVLIYSLQPSWLKWNIQINLIINR